MAVGSLSLGLLVVGRKLRRGVRRKLSPLRVRAVELLRLPALRLRRQVAGRLRRGPMLSRTMNSSSPRSTSSGSISLDSCGPRSSSAPTCHVCIGGRNGSIGPRCGMFSIGRDFRRDLRVRLNCDRLENSSHGVTVFVVNDVSSSKCLHHSLLSLSSSVTFELGVRADRRRLRRVLGGVRRFRPMKIKTESLHRYLLLRLRTGRRAGRESVTIEVLASCFSRFSGGRCSGVVTHLRVSGSRLGSTVSRVIELGPHPNNRVSSSCVRRTRRIAPSFILSGGSNRLMLSVPGLSVPRLEMGGHCTSVLVGSTGSSSNDKHGRTISFMGRGLSSTG